MRTLNRSSTFAALEDIMTGPRTPTLHPCLRRPWLLLPFLATVLFLPMACTGDQPTESTLPSDGSSATPIVSHPRELNQDDVVAAAIKSGYLQPTAAGPRVSASIASVGS